MDPNERVVCAGCGARVRIRRKPIETPADGFLRFFCACGKRLKVDASAPPSTGKCPDCGRVVPSASTSHKPPGHPDADTVELTVADRSARDRWAADHLAEGPQSGATATATTDRKEVGLRVCPKCGLPIHLGADSCRGCGTHVPRR